jgi:acetyl-CoA carboxylase, biotin carboxylase subunit
LFKKILIANRGEIAVRIIRACRELGITSAAVYSEADVTALHTKLADESYFIGTAQSSDSYLNKSKIIELAKKINADAIHPGYGFFSENADFIKTVENENIVFIGPPSSAVSLMGSKTAARNLMKQNNVPIVPGTTEPIKSVEEGIETAKSIGFPVLLKASAGGGGKGMRKISSEEEFISSFEATQREALKAFADDSIYIEKYIQNPHHIEVQIIADKQGNYVHLFERECSVQRRHQKIVEESPSAFVDDITRGKITAAGINAAKACGYYNAGTIEFLMDANKKFYFLEMNTRIQVEHPVTEMITGIDLVKEQISIASGNSLSFTQNDIKINGHAIECRIYAEDFKNNFLPSSGKIIEYKEPAGPGIRLDSGFSRESVISIHYDPLISKLVAWSNNRESSISRMKRALSEYYISGIVNNIPLLNLVLENEYFVNGNYDINFIEEHLLNTDNVNSINSNNSNVDYENAAVIMASVLKSKISVNGNQNKNHNANKWLDQLYE